MNPHVLLRQALGPLVGDRYYPNHFPQEPGPPTWPAIRGTVVTRENFADLCGSGDDDTEDPQVQIDLCAKDQAAVEALRLAVYAAMRGITDPPAVRQPGGFDTYDEAAKVHRVSVSYTFYPSSEGDDSPP